MLNFSPDVSTVLAVKYCVIVLFISQMLFIMTVRQGDDEHLLFKSFWMLFLYLFSPFFSYYPNLSSQGGQREKMNFAFWFGKKNCKIGLTALQPKHVGVSCFHLYLSCVFTAVVRPEHDGDTFKHNHVLQVFMQRKWEIDELRCNKGEAC